MPQRWTQHACFDIAELGFGTGLNFLETWRQWCTLRTPTQHLNFTSFEAYPLEASAIERAISIWPELTPFARRLTEFWPRLTSTPTSWKMDTQTTLTIIKADAAQGVRDWQGKAHAWYLDGFSPANNPEMWSQELLSHVYSHTHDNGTFATYTSAGWVRRNLQSAGFNVEKTPGHGRKRHMLVGVRQSENGESTGI